MTLYLEIVFFLNDSLQIGVHVRTFRRILLPPIWDWESRCLSTRLKCVYFRRLECQSIERWGSEIWHHLTNGLPTPSVTHILPKLLFCARFICRLLPQYSSDQKQSASLGKAPLGRFPLNLHNYIPCFWRISLCMKRYVKSSTLSVFILFLSLF